MLGATVLIHRAKRAPAMLGGRGFRPFVCLFVFVQKSLWLFWEKLPLAGPSELQGWGEHTAWLGIQMSKKLAASNSPRRLREIHRNLFHFLLGLFQEIPLLYFFLHKSRIYALTNTERIFKKALVKVEKIFLFQVPINPSNA